MEGQSGLSELSVISWVSAFEGCSLGGVPLYTLVSVQGSRAESHGKHFCGHLSVNTFDHNSVSSGLKKNADVNL